MKINPNKKSQIRVNKTALLTILSIAALLIIIVIADACSDGKDSETDDGSSSSESENVPPTESADKTDDETDGEKDDYIFIPIETPDAAPPSLAVSEAELEAALLTVTQDLGEEQADKYYFLCDSVIYGMKTLGMLSDGPKSDRVITGVSSSFSLLSGKDALVYLPKSDKILSAPDAIAEIRPEYLLLSVGTDEILKKADMSDTDFYNAYRELVLSLREASPETVIVCMPILPGSDGSGLGIYKAETYNSYIHASAAEFGAYFIDIASAYSNASGYLRIDCDAGESCLNTTGLRKLLELIRTYDVPASDTDAPDTK